MSHHAALVTGASTGIGRAVAEALLDDGYGVTICARTPDKLDQAAGELAEHGDVQALVADVGKDEDVTRLLDAHRERFGRLDVLMNNAGVLDGGPLGETPIDQLDALVANNVRSFWLVTTAALPLLKQAGAEHGCALIVTMASIIGHFAQAGTPAYSATKAALIALSQSVHEQLAESGVSATTIAPGFVASPTSAIFPVPPEEMIQPRDIAETVRYLTRLGSNCCIPEIKIVRPVDRMFVAM